MSALERVEVRKVPHTLRPENIILYVMATSSTCDRTVFCDEW